MKLAEYCSPGFDVSRDFLVNVERNLELKWLLMS